MSPLSTVLSVVTMTQIVSTLASLPQWAGHPGHIPSFQSALYPILTDTMFPPDLLQELSCCSPRTQRHSSLCSARWCSTASTKLVSPKFQSLLFSLS